VVTEVLFSGLSPSKGQLAVLNDGRWTSYTLTGVLAELAAAFWWHRTPIGIVIDRLEEYPNECQAPEEIVRAAVAWLRQRHSTG
jgi:hypothetical protein